MTKSSSNGINGRKNGSNGIKVETSNVGVGPGSPVRPGTGSSLMKGMSLDSYENSPISPSVEDNGHARSGTKRACNECRQQKLRCDVQQDPYVACTRCRKTKIECRIDPNFRRVGKRKRNAEMEQELEQLRKKLADHEASDGTAPVYRVRDNTETPSRLQDHPDSHDALISLMDMRRGSAGTKEVGARKLDDVLLSGDQLQELFDIFFRFYRPYQPLIDPDKPPNWFFERSPLLFWTIVAIAARHYESDSTLLPRLTRPFNRLLWLTIGSVPQDFYVVKALCLLCVWPLPVSSTSADPTMILIGNTVQIARQIGLHRPSQAQDFTKFKIDLLEEELRDRVKTWAACNVIAQRVGTGYGQPALSNYDWTLAAINGPSSDARPEGFTLPREMSARLRIEQYVYKVTEQLYDDPTDPVGLASERSKGSLVKVLAKDLDDLKQSFTDSSEMSDMNVLYIRAAALHLRLTVFFDSPSTPHYNSNLRELWLAVVSFVEHAIGLKSEDDQQIIRYTTNYIQQMLTASAFALLKLLNSPFAEHIDFDHGKALFYQVIETIRTISVSSQDLPCRLAEVLLQLWNFGGVGRKGIGASPNSLDYSLQLKVRCRMSMSLIYDSVWRWREEFRNEGYEKLEAALNKSSSTNQTTPKPSNTNGTKTNPSLSTISHKPNVMQDFQAPASTTPSLTFSKSSTNLETTLAPSLAPGFALSRSSSPAFMIPSSFSAEWENEVWDPLSWTLDGHVGLPYPLSSAGGSTAGGGGVLGSLGDFDGGNLLGL